MNRMATFQTAVCAQDAAKTLNEAIGDLVYAMEAGAADANVVNLRNRALSVMAELVVAVAALNKSVA